MNIQVLKYFRNVIFSNMLFYFNSRFSTTIKCILEILQKLIFLDVLDEILQLFSVLV